MIRSTIFSMKHILLFILLLPALHAGSQIQYYQWAFDCKFDNCYDFYEGRAIITKGRVKGFIDQTGVVQLKPSYHVIDAYSQDLASAGYINLKKMYSKSGYVNKEGELVIDTKFEVTSPFQEGLACVKKKEKWGFIDLSGDIVIKIQFQEAQNFSNGLAAVRYKGKWGFINPQGDWVVPPKFELTLPYREGVAPVRYKGRWGFIDTQGQFTIQPSFTFAGTFKDGLARVKKNNRWGFINPKGEFEILNIFTLVSDFSQGLARAQQDGKWGFLNNFGEFAIPPQYENAGDFSGGFARVKINGKWGYIDFKGQLLIPNIFSTAYDFKEGLARVNEGGSKRGYIRYVEPLEEDMERDRRGNQPYQMTKRDIKEGQEIKVNTRQLKIYLYDHMKEDGDIVSLNYNGEWILKNHQLTKNKYLLDLQLDGSIDRPYLMLFANNLGKEPPNTIALLIDDGEEKKEVILNSDLKACDIIYFLEVE